VRRSATLWAAKIYVTNHFLQPIWCKSNKTCKISQYIIKFTAWWFRTIIEDGAYGMFHYVFHWTIGCVMSVVFSYWSRCNMYKNNVYRTMFNPVP
jgi:hypothetical protein